MRKFSVCLALLCAVATCVLGAPDADPYGYSTYPEKIHKYGYTRSKLVLPARRPWTYGGKNSPYGPLYTPDTFARRHYGVHRPALNAYRRSRFHVARRVGPKTLVKTYVKPKSAPAIHYEPAPAPAPVVHETYVEPAPLPVVHRRRKPIPTVRRIEIPVEKEYHYVEPAPAPAPVAVHKTYVEPAPVAVETYADPAPVYVEEPAYAVAEPAPLPAPTPAVAYYDEPAAVVEVASPAGRVVDSHSDGINLHGNREITHARTIAAVDHTAHHSITEEHGPGHFRSTNVDHVDHGLHQVTAVEQSEHDLHRDREYHKITHEEVHPNLNGGPPIRKRITHGYKRPAPHVQTLYNKRVEVPVAKSYPVHPSVGGHSIHYK